MSDGIHDFHDYAGAKLRRVLGEQKGASTLDETLITLGLARIDTASDLHRVARALIATGGFAGAVGGLLSVHAVIHGARPSQTE